MMKGYQKTPDIVIKNGMIVDGSGTMPYYADIAIVGDKIDCIGNLQDVDAKLVIDAAGKYVTPGFIDAHTHSDYTIWATPECYSAIYQGVTTEVVGNCGYSCSQDLDGIPFDKAGDGIECVYDLGENNFRKGAMAAVLDKMDKMGASMNTAWLCGHNSLRQLAGVYGPNYTEEQFQLMADILREAMDAGFIGFSTGLELTPGVASRPEEVEKLAMIAGEYADARYSTHMRDEGLYILEAIEEFLNVIRKSGMYGTVSHLNVKYDNGVPDEYLQKGMDMLKRARADEHLNVMCDMLPTCFATGSVMAMMPPWLYENSWEEARQILSTPEGRARVRADFNRYWRFLDADQWDRLLNIKTEHMPEINSKTFAQLVEEWGKSPFDCMLDIVQAAESFEVAQKIMMQGTVFHEQTQIDSVVRDPIYMWQTDSRVTEEEGPVAKRADNIQNYMSMTYYFAHYVRDLGAFPFEKAVQKATFIPAKHFGLKKRGLLEEGYFADINVFDLNNLKINATFADSARYCTGMDYVIVNGVPTVVQGKHNGARGGKVLRRN